MVIGTVSTDEKAELAREHGCHYLIVYTREDFVAEVERVTKGARLPVVYDSVGRDTFLKSLRPRGMMVSFGQSSGPIEPFSPSLLQQKGSLFLTRPTLFHYIASREELEASAADLFAMIASGRLRIAPTHRFPLENAAQAHRALESRATTGSIVLAV